MEIRLRSLRLHVDWLMLLFPLAAMLLGEGATAALLLCSLAAHETAHWAAARLIRLPVSSVRLTPFGGMMQIGNPYSVPPLRMCAVAAAGPVANLALVFIAALCRRLPLISDFTAGLVQINLLLMVFNLLPALPLDGGRILCALLSLRIPAASAMRVCLTGGRILALAMIAAALWGALTLRQLNLSLLIAAAFILASTSDERRALSGSRIETLMQSLRPISKPTPADVIAIDAETPPLDALRAVRAHRATLFAVYSNGKLQEITDDRTILRKILDQNASS